MKANKIKSSIYNDSLGKYKSNDPAVCTVVPAYGRDELLCRCLRSIENQTYNNITVLIVETPKSEKTISIDYTDYETEIKHLITPKHVGPIEARRIGMEHSTGKFISFLDSDDEWEPQKTEKQVRKLTNSDDSTGMCAVGNKKINKEGIQVAKNLLSQQKCGTHEAITRSIGTWSTWMIPQETMQQVGYVDTNLTTYEEYDYCLRVAMEFNIITINEPLVRKHSHGGTHMGSDYSKKIESTPIIRSRYEDLADDLGLKSRFLSHLYYNNARAARTDGEFQEASVWLKKALKISPSWQYLSEYIATVGGKSGYQLAQRIYSISSRMHSIMNK